MSSSTCRVCGAAPRGSITAREMMFGLRDEFVYDECSECGCLQLRDAPADQGRYYPVGYYSLRPGTQPHRPVREALRRWRNLLLYRAPAAVAALTASLLPKLPSEAHRWLAVTRLSRTARILDVGSGVGFLVRDLGEAGYTSVVGIDPYIDMPVRYPSGAHVMRQTIHETTGPFDLIMFHHSLEHIPDQVETLRRACELLAPGGWCLVRVPVASSHAWRHYREHWVQLDAPRHYALHTVESLRRAGARAGLTLVRVEHDSTELQFWGSEAYRRNVPLTEAPSLFTRAQMRGFRRRARALNRIGEGDQACFYFQARGAGSATGDSHPTRSDPR